ncbi:MAG: type I DNA topoisomerase [Bifidobacteriaceae bacterium]|nr:type I DNA topoisomerase [Bifidobacteriaceae bacterium]
MEAHKKLVIVESPTKAKTIGRYLGKNYQVEASVGHIRDLPQPSELPADMKKGPYGRFAVNVDDGFDPYYVIEPDKRKKVTELRKALKDATELYLATDEDREGEAIAWHLLQVLKPKVPVKRMVFHEITKEAIDHAVSSPREVDLNLVDAQETRRILDRLYGYEVSPVLWRKIRAGLSAGRVQSVATRLVVERERERMAFKAAGYWDIAATFAAEAQPFSATLTAVDGKRVATGKDFTDAGQMTGTDLIHLGEPEARRLADSLGAAKFEVSDLTEKPYKRRPAAPFTTSTLQQEASRKLRMNSRHTMRVAQRLYENGHITYMRTDSTHLSDQAIEAARHQARDLYGPDAVPSAPRHYATKSKNASEAHEAIRPSGDRFATPDSLAARLTKEELKLYELIWKRTVASQMTDATGQTVSVRLTGRGTEATATFSAAGTVITHRGFLAAYEEGRDQARYEDSAPGETRLPKLVQGQGVDTVGLEPQGHQTTPPPRYSEASLVAALEKRGIGRPSTYAATVSVIEDRGYVERRGMALVPTWLAFAVTRLLEQNFGDLVDYDFTAAMEDDLDQIAAGHEDRARWLGEFYFGTAPQGSATPQDQAAPRGTAAQQSPSSPDPAGHSAMSLKQAGLKRLVESQGEIDARDINTVPLGDGIVLRVGRYGPYLEVQGDQPSEAVKRARVPDELAPDELTLAKAHELLEAPADQTRSLGTDPVTGRTVVVKTGRFGPYVTEVVEEAPKAPKPRNASLFKSMSPDTVTLDEAVRLLSLPRVVGASLEGAEITAQNGRYGPYIKCGAESRSLPSEDDLFTVDQEQARALLAQPKQRRGAANAAPLRELGADPVSGKPVVVKDGRYGPYVTDGETNATLRKDDDTATVTLERAAQLLQDKRDRGPSTRSRRPAANKATTKKTTAARKPAARKPAAKTAKRAAATGKGSGPAAGGPT